MFSTKGRFERQRPPTMRWRNRSSEWVTWLSYESHDTPALPQATLCQGKHMSISASIAKINEDRLEARRLRESAKNLTKAANDLQKHLLREKARKIKEIRDEYINV